LDRTKSQVVEGLENSPVGRTISSALGSRNVESMLGRHPRPYHGNKTCYVLTQQRWGKTDENCGHQKSTVVSLPSRRAYRQERRDFVKMISRSRISVNWRENLSYSLPVVAIGAVVVVLFITDIHLLILKQPLNIPQLSNLALGDKIKIILASALVIFAQVQANSTLTQIRLERGRNVINEMEKLYGPIYHILNKLEISQIEEDKLIIHINDLSEMNRVISQYPFMLTREIFELWRNKILGIGVDSRLGFNRYHIPLEFREKVNNEYEKMLKSYCGLFGGKPHATRFEEIGARIERGLSRVGLGFQ